MIEYFKWIIEPKNINSNIFTLISVLLSGIVSWVISAAYFYKGNRDNLRISMVYPIQRLLEKRPTWDKYMALTELAKDYSAKYLKNRERIVIDNLLLAYKSVCNYSYESVCAESLFSYFKYKLKKNGIDPSPIPVYIEGELVDVEFPPDMLYMQDELARVVEQYLPEFDTENCEKAIIKLFDIYTKKCYTDTKIIFFDDSSITNVLKKSKNRKGWNEKFNHYKEAKENFLNMKVVKR